MVDPAQDTVRSVRPTFQVGGQERPQLADGLLEMVVEESRDGLYRCEATFANWGDAGAEPGFLHFERDVLDFGEDLVVQTGGEAIFTGRITALEGRFPEGRPPEITVMAEDALQDLRMTRRTRTFEDQTDADVAQTLASDHGLGADVDMPGSQHRVLAQVNQSDLAFLRERARAVGAEVWIADGSLHVGPRPTRADAPVVLSYRARLREAAFLADLAGQRTSVVASGWDVSGKEAVEHAADDSILGGEIADGDSGASVLQQAFGPRTDTVAHRQPGNAQEARTEAEAAFRAMARDFVTGECVAETQADLRVGAEVELDGVGPLFNGVYVITEARHVFDGSLGLRTEFSVARASLGRP